VRSWWGGVRGLVVLTGVEKSGSSARWAIRQLTTAAAKDTRLKVLATEGDVVHIEVVDGAQVAKTGWIDKGQIKDEA
jgi:hypothetical protein